MKARLSGIVCAAAVALGAVAYAQQPVTEVILTATSANVSEPGAPVRIRIMRWSTDQDRDRLVTALNPPPPAPAPAAAAAGAEQGGAARGGRAAGRGAAGGRGGRGGGRGGANAAPPSPTAAVTTAIAAAPTIGYIWTNDVTGYSIKYAYRMPMPDGGERIILATDRRFGAHAPAWTPSSTTPATEYEFTFLEVRLGAKAPGEGKTSLLTKVVVDTEAKMLALENYAAAPAMLQNVRISSTGHRP